jgi:DNA mismatch repair protein MutS
VNENAKTLLDVLDQTVSPMGSRQLRRWIILPLKNIQPIGERLDAVEYFTLHGEATEQIRHYFQQIGDLERLISKVAVARVNPREMIYLKRALDAIELVKLMCESSDNEGLRKIGDQLHICQLVRDRIDKEINPDPPALAIKGNIIREGIDPELDELRKMAYSGKDFLVSIQQREMERTGISSLKIGFTNVFGYYLEVTNSHKDKVPADWQRKQTLVNAERYITEELKVYEEKILHAEEKMMEIELKLYNDLILFMADYIQPIQLNASLIARLDVLVSFAVSAVKFHYVRPELNNSVVLDIKSGRHPVIERQMKPGEEYIANDVYLDERSQQIIILTGPNMSGKSALLRQTALIVLMAQMGSFVPAAKAVLGLTDKVFTRVGASDNISSGESTFMVEMNETASILNNISNRSLILLDEIGRGTSTYDGISIAWSIAEYLHEHPLFRPKVLFATHYHELNEMASTMKRIRNFHVSIKEINNKVIFLRKLVPGGTEHSFGIHVAKMAGMPGEVIERANRLLQTLEKSHSSNELNKNLTSAGKPKDDYQLSFIQLDDPLLLQIKDDILSTDINTLTPVEALMKLNQIKNLLKKK